MRRLPLARSALALLLAVSACKKAPPEAPRAVLEPPIERGRLGAPRPVATGSAFDLVAVPGGAVLVFGRGSRNGGGVFAVRLDEWGTVRGEVEPVYTPELPRGGSATERIAEDALEIDADVARGSIAVAWVARYQLELGQKVAFGDLDTLRFSPAATLGPTVRTETNARGWTAVAASDDGRFHTLARLENVPCSDGSPGPCARFGHAEIRGNEVVPAAVELVVPSPCPSPLAGLGWVGPRLHYGVCSARTGRPITTVYTIETDSAVARSEDALPGCSGVTFFEAPNELLVLGSCEGGPAGARQARDGSALRALPMDRLEVRCEGRTAIIGTGATNGVEIRLDRPYDGLERILPPSLVPAGARAAFTGKTVLIAQPVGGEVTLHRFDCDQGQFRQTDFM